MQRATNFPASVLKALETVPDLYLILSPDLYILTASEAYLKATFTRRETIQGRYVFEVFPDNPATPQANATKNLLESLQTVLTTKTNHRMPLQHYDVPQGGEQAGFIQKYWLPSNTPVLTEGGEIHYIIHKVEDVTGQVVQHRQLEGMEQAAKRVEKKLLQAETVGQLGSFIGHLSTHIFEFSEGMFHLIGHQPHSFVPTLEWLYSITHPQDINTLRGMWNEVIQGRQPFGVSFRIYHSDGALRYLSLKGQVQQDPVANTFKLIGTAQDVTEQKLAEQALKENQELLQTVFDAAPLSLTVYKILYEPSGAIEDFEIAMFNTFTIRTTGLTDYLGKRYSKLFPHTIESGVFETFKKVATSGQGVDFEQWYQGEGMRHWFRFIVVKQEQLLVVITEDITARKQAEQALIEANKNLTQSNTTLARTNVDLDNFVYTASHDLKAPISNIEGLIKLLEAKLQKQGYWDEHILRLVAMVHASISRFKETVADLTKVANVQKQVDSPTEVVDMKEVMEGILLDLHEDIRASAANIELQMDEGVKIVFTKKNFKSIFYNLISNALKYRHAERNPHITLTCQLQGAYQVVSVEDNGLGLNTKDENKIFGMFKRQHNHVEGSGIGLYLVKRMIENAGGKITVESKLGIGSTFRIYFPHQVEISHDIK